MIDTALSILDAPGGFVRNLLSGRNPFALDDEHRASGRDVLESWGLLGSNTPGLDFGDVLGFGAEILLDPLNALGGLGIARTLGRAGAIGRSNRAAASHNLLVDAARAKADEVARYTAERDLMDAINQRVAQSAGRTINVGEVPEVYLRGLQDTAKRYGGEYSDEAALDLIYGDPTAVKRGLGQIAGTTFGDPHPAVSKMLERSDVRAMGFPQRLQDSEAQLLGFVHPARPEFVFISNDLPLPSALGMATHELTHSMARRHPESYQQVLESLGPPVVNRGAKKYFKGNSFKELMAMIRGGRGAVSEEGVATALESAVRGGAARQSFPLVDMAFGTGDEGAAEALAGLLRRRNPDVVNPYGASRQVVDYLAGNLDRQRALVPVGETTGPMFSPRSFAPPPQLTPKEARALALGYEPLLPQPALMRQLLPWLASLGAYNAINPFRATPSSAEPAL